MVRSLSVGVVDDPAGQPVAHPATVGVVADPTGQPVAQPANTIGETFG